ncbi:unnamed protein product [Peronospora belbahrii]|uniref:WW domain-containing protein n=1 Tax=Peronospora belbahrii TaxID=622444 RepID=A0ABN8D906_9STRA|nr:unnamed protein product [Peronospora belbahrii]
MPSRKSPDSISTDHDENAFGWQLFHDPQRNLIYYLHNYTGEVRWPRPETVGFVMHGLKPLPAYSELEAKTDSTSVDPDIWSPYYPHVVRLPSGLVQVHPTPGSNTQGTTEMWCGYNRFPLTHVGDHEALAESHRKKGLDRVAMLTSEPRILPPTWEESRSGSPFLPPYPVAILKRDDTEGKHNTMPRSPLPSLDEQFHTPVVETLHIYDHLKNGDLGRVHGIVDYAMATSQKATNATPAFKHPACQKAFPAPNTEKKEHNRKGYLLRQARKLMREGGGSTQAIASASTSKQRKNQETAVPTMMRLQRPVEENHKNCTAYRDETTLLVSQ